jgi:MSHA biogenesis protein MshO
MTRSLPNRGERGFTLIEAIVVIVVLGVLATAVAVFIRAPIQSYADAVGRAEVTDEADLALRRMARDIRLALPNSVRVNGDRSALEFLLTKTGGRYLAAEDSIDGPILDFVDASKTTFTVLGGLQSFSRAVAGDYVVVYNLGNDIVPSDAYHVSDATTNIAQIASFGTAMIPDLDATNPFPTIQLKRNPFATQGAPELPPMPSPMQRFQIVSGPVSYYCSARADGTLDLWRHWDYPISQVQSVPPAGGQRALVASRLASCQGIFEYSTSATQRSGLVILALALKARNERDPNIRLVHQVHVDNTP